MRTRTVRDMAIALPSDDPADLDPVAHVPSPGERVTDRTLTGDLWARATISDCAISHCWITDADLSATSFTNVTLERCVLTGCTLQGANWSTITVKDVVIDNCRLDYSTLAHLTTRAPFALLNTSLTEAAFTDGTLTKAVFDACQLGGLELERCDLRGADLRGNDLHGLTAVTGLRGVTLSQDQLAALTDRLVHELSITVTGTP